MKKFWLSAVGVIILGALGSGLWENILKPLSGFFGSFLLTISTLGVQSFKNNIYIEIAQGFHEESSLEILSLFLGLMVAFILSACLVKILMDTNENSRLRKFFKVQRGLMNSRIFIILYLLFFIVITSILLFREEYVNKSITYYNQLEQIAKPYMSQDQRFKIESSFAQIQTRQNYVDVLNQLTSVIENNHQTAPASGFIF